MFDKYVLKTAILCFAFISIIHSQDNFVHTFFSNTVSQGFQILQHEDRIFIASGKIIDNREASVVKEINESGEIVWSRDIPWLDITRQTMLIDDNSLLLASNTYNDLKSIALYRMSLDGDSLSTNVIVDTLNDYGSIYIQDMLKFNSEYVIAGSGVVNDSMFALLFLISKDGELKNTIIPSVSNHISASWDVLVDNQSRLNVFIRYREAWGDGVRIVKKYNSDLEEVFSYTSEPEFYNYSYPYCSLLNDGCIAYVSGHVKETTSAIQGIIPLNTIRALNEDGSISWQFKYPDEPSYKREMLFMQTLSNGNILSGGLYSTGLTDPPIINVPFIVCVSPDGEFLWERAYVQYDEDGDTRLGVISDVLELDDGDLLLLGYLTEEDNQNILLMRTDSEGCVIESCDPVSEIVGVDDVEIDDVGIEIYPNPVSSDVLNVYWDAKSQNSASLVLRDYTGRLLLDTRINVGNNAVDMANIPKGILLVSIMQNGKLIKTDKVVKLD